MYAAASLDRPVTGVADVEVWLAGFVTEAEGDTPDVAGAGARGSPLAMTATATATAASSPATPTRDRVSGRPIGSISSYDPRRS